MKETTLIEALHYLGYTNAALAGNTLAGCDSGGQLSRTWSGGSGDTPALARDCFAELEQIAAPAARHGVFTLCRDETGFTVPQCGLPLYGRSMARLLDGCERVALMLATLGAEVDRQLRLYETVDVARAVVFDACASALIEEFCDDVQQSVADAHPGDVLTRRFSPGYGDLTLSLQRDFLRVLDRSGTLGVTVGSGFLLTPSKTVTAVIGLRKSKG